ncbi:MAG: hypothetical protein IJM87_04430 [Ruminococcus sp.]|nr:hypothetical protein [Ruminococcus sp.]
MVFRKITDRIYLAVFALVIIVAVWGAWDHAVSLANFHPAVVALGILSCAAGGAILAYGLYILQKRIEKSSDPETVFRRTMIGGLIFILVAQIVLIYICDVDKLHDLSYIETAAKNLVTQGSAHLHEGLPEHHRSYFYVYPNNHTLLVMVSGLYKLEMLLFGEIKGILPIFVNTLGLDLSFVITCLCAKLLYGSQKAAVCCIRAVLFTPLISYAVIYYTDTMAMPWLTGAVYLWLRQRNEQGKKRFILLALSALLLSVGFRIKSTPIIFAAAAVIDSVITVRPIKKLAAQLAVFLAVFAAGAMLISFVCTQVLDLDKDELEARRFPPVHWVMMSADGNGGYNPEDFYYTKSFTGYEAKEHADMKRLDHKLHEQGVLGIAEHFTFKLSYSWRDGAFMIGHYMKGFLKSRVWYSIAFITWYALMFFTFQRFFIACKNEEAAKGSFVLRLTLMGLTLFLLIWEARIRYLISFMCLFALI